MWISYTKGILLCNNSTAIKFRELTLKQCWPLMLTVFLSLLGSRIHLGSCVVFSYHVSLASFLCRTVLWSLSFTAWHFWRVLVTYFIECSSIWACLIFPHDQIWVIHSWQGYRSDAVPFSVHRIMAHNGLCSITTNVSFEHWVRWCLLGLSTVKLFSCSYWSILWGDTLRLALFIHP